MSSNSRSRYERLKDYNEEIKRELDNYNMEEIPVSQIRDGISKMSIDPKKRKYEPKTSIISKNTDTEEPDIKKINLMNQHERHKAIILRQQENPVAEMKRKENLISLNDPDKIAAFERNKKMITDENMYRDEKIDILDDTVLDNDTNVAEYILYLVGWINESHKKFIDKGIIIRINLKPREIELVSNIYYRIVELYPELSNELGKRYTIYTALYYYLSTHIDALSSAIKVLRRIFGRLVEYAYYNVIDKSKKGKCIF